MIKKGKDKKIIHKIHLDVGCGYHCNDGFVGMDKRELPNVQIVHDAEVFPWPLDDNSCAVIVVSHLIEHIKPWLAIDFVDECWRVLDMGSHLMIKTPYGGSPRYFQDLTHCQSWTEITPQYFCPEFPFYNVYRPKPWKAERVYFNPLEDLEIALKKIEPM